MKLKSLTSFRKKNDKIKAQSYPIILDIKRDNIFRNQKCSLECLSNLIKFNEVNFFSSSYSNNNPIFIIETLENLKQSLFNSLNNQIKEKYNLSNKVKIDLFNFFLC